MTLKRKSVPLGTPSPDSGQIKVGSLFAAIGGFCKAFQLAGASIAWANEKDQYATQTFRLNFPRVRHLHKPVEQVSVVADRLKPVDIMTAGFPCQPFSIAGRQLGFEDDRGLLFMHIIRLIREFGAQKPKVLLLENVKNLKTHDTGRTFELIQKEIQKVGYWLGESNAKILNTAHYTDIPQHRERLFMVALNCDFFSANTFQFPDRLPPGFTRSVRNFLDLHQKADDRYYFVPGSQYYSLFREAIDNGDKESVFQLRRSYVRENKTDTCFTLMANMGQGGHNQPVIRDRWGIRKLTPRECARLQGYTDDWFKIPEVISNSQIYKQLGNSVTVTLVERLAKNILQLLNQTQSASDPARCSPAQLHFRHLPRNGKVVL